MKICKLFAALVMLDAMCIAQLDLKLQTNGFYNLQKSSMHYC